MSGAAGGAAVGGGGSVAAVIAPADMECAPAAVGAPVDIPFVKDCARDCGDKGGADAAGVETPGIDGPPTPTAGAPGWRGGGASGGGVLPGGIGLGPVRASPTTNDVCAVVGAGTSAASPLGLVRALLTNEVAGAGSSGGIVWGIVWALPTNDCVDGELGWETKSSAVTGSDGGGASRFAPCSRNHVRALPPMVASRTRCVASMIFDNAVVPALAALPFFSAMTAFTAATFAPVDPLPDRI